MPTIKIKHLKTGETLYSSSSAPNVGVALEMAAKEGRSLRGADLRNQNLARLNLYGIDMPEADVSGSDLSDTNLGEASLYRLNAQGCNLTNATLNYADGRYADLRGSNMQKAKCFNATLLMGKLEGVNLTEGDMRGVNLGGANMRQTVLNKADFCNAHLTGIEWTGVNVAGVADLSPIRDDFWSTLVSVDVLKVIDTLSTHNKRTANVTGSRAQKILPMLFVDPHGGKRFETLARPCARLMDAVQDGNTEANRQLAALFAKWCKQWLLANKVLLAAALKKEIEAAPGTSPGASVKDYLPANGENKPSTLSA